MLSSERKIFKRRAGYLAYSKRESVFNTDTLLRVSFPWLLNRSFCRVLEKEYTSSAKLHLTTSHVNLTLEVVQINGAIQITFPL
jgi:hypothetical protein